MKPEGNILAKTVDMNTQTKEQAGYEAKEYRHMRIIMGGRAMDRRHTYKVKNRGRLTRSVLLLLLLVLLATATFFVLRTLARNSVEVEPTPVITASPTPTATPTPTPTATPTPSLAQVVRIKLLNTASSVRVRKQPSTTAQILGEVKHNVTLPYLGKTDTWWTVSYQNQTGYIQIAYGVLETATASPSPTP